MLHDSEAQPKAASCTLGTNSAAESRSLSLQQNQRASQQFLDLNLTPPKICGLCRDDLQEFSNSC